MVDTDTRHLGRLSRCFCVVVARYCAYLGLILGSLIHITGQRVASLCVRHVEYTREKARPWAKNIEQLLKAGTSCGRYLFPLLALPARSWVSPLAFILGSTGLATYECAMYMILSCPRLPAEAHCSYIGKAPSRPSRDDQTV